MRVIVYYPKSENTQKELIRRVSEVHAEFVLDYIKRLQLSKEYAEQQKIKRSIFVILKKV